MKKDDEYSRRMAEPLKYVRAGEIEIVRKPRVGEVCFAKAVSAFEYKNVPKGAYAVYACQKPTEYVIAFDVRRMKPKFSGFGFDFIFRNHQFQV
jgi:hypothetical protein